MFVATTVLFYPDLPVALHASGQRLPDKCLIDTLPGLRFDATDVVLQSRFLGTTLWGTAQAA